MQIQTVVKSFSLTSFIHNRKFQRCNVLQKFEKKWKFTTVCMEKPLDRDIFSIRHLHVSHNAPYFPPPPTPASPNFA